MKKSKLLLLGSLFCSGCIIGFSLTSSLDDIRTATMLTGSIIFYGFYCVCKILEEKL